MNKQVELTSVRVEKPKRWLLVEDYQDNLVEEGNSPDKDQVLRFAIIGKLKINGEPKTIMTAMREDVLDDLLAQNISFKVNRRDEIILTLFENGNQICPVTRKKIKNEDQIINCFKFI